VALPSITEIVFSGYSQRISNKTGKVEDEYLYSVRVDRNKWREIEFNNLQHIDVVACFEQFSLIRKISSAGVINPITPFEVN
jgi:hypothetical protein